MRCRKKDRPDEWLRGHAASLGRQVGDVWYTVLLRQRLEKLLDEVAGRYDLALSLGHDLDYLQKSLHFVQGDGRGISCPRYTSNQKDF